MILIVNRSIFLFCTFSFFVIKRNAGLSWHENFMSKIGLQRVKKICSEFVLMWCRLFASFSSEVSSVDGVRSGCLDHLPEWITAWVWSWFSCHWDKLISGPIAAKKLLFMEYGTYSAPDEKARVVEEWSGRDWLEVKFTRTSQDSFEF